MNLQITLKKALVAGGITLAVLAGSWGLGYYKGEHVAARPEQAKQTVVKDTKVDDHTVTNANVNQEAKIDKSKAANVDTHKKVTVVTVVEKPSGEKKTTTVTAETDTKDRSTEASNAHVDTNGQIGVDQTHHEEDHTKEVVVVKNERANWRIDGDIEVNAGNFHLDALAPVYGITVEKRLVGPIWIGVGANSEKFVKVTVGFEF